MRFGLQHRALSRPRAAPRGPRLDRSRRAALLLCLPLVAVELVLQLADAGLVGRPAWRPIAYSYGALWRGLLGNWQPNFPGQWLAMFVTYPLLHAGLGHLLGNVAGLIAFGPRSARRAGARGLLAIAVAASLGGAVAFVLLSGSVRPMVGASGAAYGLAAAWLYWDGGSTRRALGLAAALMAANLAHWWLVAGDLAWEAHAGGMIAGWLCAARIEARNPQRSRR